MNKRKKKYDYDHACVMFFDVKDYSKLKDSSLKDFHNYVFKDLADIIEKIDTSESSYRCLYKNTWGDGITLLHKDCFKIAEIGLFFRDYFSEDDNYIHYDNLRAETLRARIAIHKCRFLYAYDPIRESPGFFGQDVVRGARIEPITDAGTVYITSEFKRELEDNIEIYGMCEKYQFELIGNIELAKTFGTKEIWKLKRYRE